MPKVKRAAEIREVARAITLRLNEEKWQTIEDLIVDAVSQAYMQGAMDLAIQSFGFMPVEGSASGEPVQEDKPEVSGAPI